ncbi:hypothetical protein V5O48_015230 [Marasmius crinis-equi]|uniref:DUF6729 domain-containing protein n=1 Tax=Marasmius crinis-equi TaxID=585013 RepID=A0ABR3EV48_9AGAR
MSNDSQGPSKPPVRQHGGWRAGAGRPRGKKITKNSSSQSDAAVASTSSQNDSVASTSKSQPKKPATNVPVFFAQRIPQGVSRPLPASSNNPTFTEPGASNPTGRVESGPQSREDILERDGLERLAREMREVSEHDEFADIRVEAGRVIDESIENDDEDSMEANAKAAKEETDATEVVEHTVIHRYLLNYRNQLQQEIQDNGQPQCYAEGQFFTRPRHPVFALHENARTSFTPDSLCFRPIFLWHPQHLPGRPENYKCVCGKHLTMNGYNDKPIARRVRTTTGEDYFLLTNRYICDPRRANNRGCGTSYQGTDPQILAQLPRWVQEAFPAYLTSRSAVDKLVIDQMKACFAGRFGPDPFSKMLHEIQMLEHSRRELMYLSAAATYSLSGPTQVPPFPQFDDRTTYAGSSPSLHYIKTIWSEYHRMVKLLEDRIQASLSGWKLAGDHTFGIMKAMARLKSEPIFGALFSLVNEWEEIRAQAMALTKGFSILPQMFTEVSVGLKEHGHQPTAVYYCDNPPAERDFHERVTSSLKDHVEHIPAQTETTPPVLPLFKLPASSSFESYDTFMLINDCCDGILEAIESLHSNESLTVALSVQQSDSAPHSLRNIHLRTRNKAIVLDITSLSSDRLPASLRALLTSPRIVKVGHDIKHSLTSIATFFDMPDLIPMLESNDGFFLDVGMFAKLKGAVEDPYASLGDLVHAVLKRRLPDDPSSSSPASQEEWSAAGMLRIGAIWEIFLSLSKYKSVGLALSPSETRVGQLVTLVASRKDVAEGIIVDHEGFVDVVMDNSGSQMRLKITPAYSVVKITKVLVPGQVVTKNKQTLQWVFEHGGKAVVQTRTLRSRNPIPPLPINPSSTSLLGVPAPPPSFSGSESATPIGPSQNLLERSEPEPDADDDGEEREDGYNNSESDIETDDEEEEDRSIPLNEDDYAHDDDFDADHPEPPSEELIINALRVAREIFVQAAPDHLKNYASRVFDDAFHFMDRLLKTLPKKHTAFKEFAHQFSETIFVRDAEDLKAVKAVIEKKGLSWDFVVRAKKTWLNRHVRRYIPPPERLEADLKKLFDSFRNIICSSDRKRGRGRFFSKESVKASEGLLESVRRGFLSDPPGISLYYIIGWDRDKLPVYRTIRGTNSIEGGVHMLIRRVFGSMKASPELAVSLLSNWILRRNQRVGHFNRTGKRWRNHYDIWLLDEVAELAIQVNVKPSFPLPRMLATRIATSESFGVIPIPSALAEDYNILTLPARRVEGLPHHHDTPAHMITRLSTKITSPYRYLQLTQRTVYPVIPVHTPAEYVLFKQLISLETIRTRSSPPPNQPWKGINYIQLAKIWNTRVDGQDPRVINSDQRLYYKLPEQLLRHHKKVLEWQASRATMQLGSNVRLVQEHMDSLRDPERVARVLPAVPLSEIEPDPTTYGALGIDLTSFNTMALVQRDINGNERSDAHFDDADIEEQRNDESITQEQDIPEESPENPQPSPTPPTIHRGTFSLTSATTSAVSLTAAMDPGTIGGLDIPVAKKQRTVPPAHNRRERQCTVCKAHNCSKASSCPGSGGRHLCYSGFCNHPSIGKQRVRGPSRPKPQ